mmetsp:Transcript_43464/g.82931  ORF Transcript_43464/g.82931 Transcript_43464/m.82931 type:complete len:377 (+) Transcript_43464:202-1332(+)
MGLSSGHSLVAVIWVDLVLVVSLQIFPVSANDDINPETNRVYNEIVIGGLGIKGKGPLYSQWNDTFAVYLSEQVGPKFGVTFRLKYLDFNTTYDAVEKREVDMVYTNPSVYACLEREYRASPIVSLRNRRKVGNTFHELDHFYGTIFVKSDSPITKISEIENRTVEAVSLIGLGACQLQWDELTNRGIQFLSAPRQVRFTSSQQQIVRDVIAGDVDIGMVRTDLAEAMVSDGEIEPGAIRVLENLQNRSDDPAFPFPHSTRLAAPEWTLGALPWMDWTISREARVCDVSVQRVRKRLTTSLRRSREPRAFQLEFASVASVKKGGASTPSCGTANSWLDRFDAFLVALKLRLNECTGLCSFHFLLIVEVGVMAKEYG